MSDLNKQRIATLGTIFASAERNLNANFSADCGAVLVAWDAKGRFHVTNANDAELIAVLEGLIAAVRGEKIEETAPMQRLVLSQ